MKLFKLSLSITLILLSMLLTSNISESACTCSVTGARQFAVLNPSANPVDSVEFKLIAPYTFGAMVPPANWTVTLTEANTRAVFTANNNPARITANDCKTFTLNINSYSDDIILVLASVTAYDSKGTKIDLDTNFAGLLANILAIPSSVANSSTITVYMTVQNNSTSIATVAPSALTLSSPALASYASGPSPATLSIAPGTSGVFAWTYTSASSPTSGSLTFSGSARDADNCLDSQWSTSNTILIGSFTALLSVVPSMMISGDTATVIMTVANNTTGAITDITPSALTTGGTATKNLSSGPIPATIPSLSPGASGSFQWTYAITGASGQTYWFQGNAAGGGGITSNTATSNTGQISSCTANPSLVINNGDGTHTVTWTLCNYSGSGVNNINFRIPWPWLISSVSTGLGTVSTQQSPTSTTNGTVAINPASLANNTCGTVSIIFSSVPTGGNYSFPVQLLGGGCGIAPINTIVQAPFMQSSLILTASPGGTASSHIITALLCANSSLSGNISFSTSGGILSSSSQPVSTSACAPCTGCPGGTNQQGTATVTLTCNSNTLINSSITGQFLSTTGSVSADLLCKIRMLDWREIAP